MRIIFYSLVVCLISLGSLSAQTFVRKVHSFPKGEKSSITNTEKLNILAVMVEFQEDRDDGTSGNGKFGTIYSKEYGTDIIDPLPHDKEYFEDHLLFAKNYFEKVSNGKLELSYNVLPNILTVSKRIREYSPEENNKSYKGLAEFSEEVWALADNNNSDINFSDYNLFVIFHAGVGNDISVPGSIGGERDLPSVYLSHKALRENLGSDFEGFSVNDGSFKITNTLLLPETENREVSGIGGTALIELSINGLTVANIASHLGLPDLFDTETGKSAIGRFGLMDGQSIFAYSGLFPPELSAWEKIYLGWETPIELGVNENLVEVTTRLVSNGQPYIYKIPINAKEYYLVENRQRDALKDGINVTYKLDGVVKEFSLPKDTTGFYSFGVDTLGGVVLDVDEFDWATPGNGILIWHIDESIIEANLDSNKINADKDNRGVDIEEADGIQDIGEEFQTIFGETAVGEGEKVDFWYKENDADLFENAFTNDSRPNTKSNSGASSLISMTEFSENDNTMSFKLSYKSHKIELLSSIPSQSISKKTKELLVADLTNNKSLFVVHGDDLHEYSVEGDHLNEYLGFIGSRIVAFSKNNKEFIYGYNDEVFSSIIRDANTESVENLDFGNNRKLLTTPVYNSESNTIIIGSDNGSITEVSLELDSLYTFSLASKEDFIHLTADRKYISTNNWYDKDYNVISSVVGPKQVVSSLDGFSSVLTDEFILSYKINALNETEVDASVKAISLADLKNNGSYYTVYCEGNKLQAINEQGISADNFPYSQKNGFNFVGQPLSVDLDGDSKSDIIASTENGMIYAISGDDGEVLEGFPISAGGELATTPVVFNYNGRASLAVVTLSNQIMVWHISDSEGEIFWGQKYADQYNSSVAPSVKSTDYVADYFPKDKAYNWPNPVYGDETNIRYYVAEDSDVKIKIFDLAGDYVAELTDKAIGGFDNETVWNVNDIQSGVYFAHLEVSGNGNSGTKIIKIAVIK